MKTNKKNLSQKFVKLPPKIKVKPSFLEWNNNILISSLKKINLDLILIVILDALFYVLTGFLVIFWLQRIQTKMAAFNLPTDVISLGYERAQQLVSNARAFYFLIIFSLILLLIVIIFFASILKGIIWAKTANAKISFALISKFLGLNLVWMSFWFLVVILISLFVQPASAQIFILATVILGLYFTNTLYTIFMKEQKFGSLIKAIRLSITKTHLFLLPCIVIGLLFFIMVRAGNLMNFGYSQILLGLILLVYTAIVRYYISTLVLEIGK